MSNLQNDKYLEDLKDAEQDFEDCAEALNDDKLALMSAKRWVRQSQENFDHAEQMLEALKNKEI